MLKLLSCKIVATHLDISLPTLCRMIRRNEIPHVLIKKGKRRIVKFRETDIDAWIESRLEGGEGRKSRRNRNVVATRNPLDTQPANMASETPSPHLSGELAPREEMLKQ